MSLEDFYNIDENQHKTIIVDTLEEFDKKY
jgi:hypothetical protein